MATKPDTTESPDVPAKRRKRVTLLDAMQAENLVPLLPSQDVARIGNDALAEYAIDLASCEDFHERYDRAMDMALQVARAKTWPWPNASNVILPLLTQAAIQFQARAYPAIVDGDNVAKCQVLGPDPAGEKAARAQRVASHLNWQLLDQIPGWEEDTDRLLLMLPIVGCMFRKAWHDPIISGINSETVPAKDFIVNMKTVSLEKVPRYTHRQRYYPHEIEAFIRSGAWAKVTYEGEDGADPYSLVEIYEQFRLIDLDGDGLPEPYVVTLTDKGDVARIVACFDKDGIHMASETGFEGQKPMGELVGDPASIPKDAKVVRIEAKAYFIKYGFIPAPDGSFYDIGFGTLTDNLGAAVNTIVNQLIDAGTLANMQGGFLGGGTKIKGGNMRFTPGEWKRVEGATAGPLRDNILPLQLPGPSDVLFKLLGMLTDSIKEITSVSDILAGNQESQTAPTTALALIEQGQKVFTAIYKRIHRALGQELKIIFGLNRDYLDEQQYYALEDTQGVIGRADYQTKDLDVRPVSDPSAINDRMKMARAQVLMGFNGDPLVNQLEIRKRALEAAGIEDIPKLLTPPAPQGPPPDVLAKAAQALATAHNQNAQAASALIAAAGQAYQVGQLLGDQQIQGQANHMLALAMSLADAVSASMGGDDGQPAAQSGPVPQMGGAAGEQSLLPVPAGSPADAGPLMGGGQPALGAGPGQGGGIGGTGEPGA